VDEHILQSGPGFGPFERGIVPERLDGALQLVLAFAGHVQGVAEGGDVGDAGFFAQVCPGAEDALDAGAAAFAASGVTGTLRVVPTQNALVEKIKILDAGLADWAIEMMKVLLLASIGELDRVLLFDALDGDVLRWLMFDEDGRLEHVSSPRSSV